MSIYFVDLVTYLTLFEFDCEVKEDKRTEIDWTEYPIESGANVANFGVTKEDKFRVEGIVTAWPFAIVPKDYSRVIQADDAIRALAKRKQPLTLITGWWTPTVTIKVVSGSTGQADGEALKMAIECTTITQPTPAYTTIPASRLKPTVRKRNGGGKDGGAVTGKAKTVKEGLESALHKMLF